MMPLEGVLTSEAGGFSVVGRGGEHGEIRVLQAGAVFELMVGDIWQRVRLESGGYRGWYYVTQEGHKGRLAVCMRVRFVEMSQGSPLAQARLCWVGKQAQTRVLIGGSVVRGVVKQITDRGLVRFVYQPGHNAVSVVLSFRVERLSEVLEPVSEQEAV